MLPRRWWLLLLCLPGTGLLLGLSDPIPLAADDTETAAERPRLVVLVVFDQMRGDYLKRWEKHYGQDGFVRLQKEAAWYTNCHYPYAGTLTAAGHASLVTGCPPRKHGIIANYLYDRVTGKDVVAARSERYQPVPAPVGVDVPIPSGAPVRRRSPAVADALLAATKGRSKVVALSIKDRAAALLAALRACLCYWFSTHSGQFGTSTYYSDGLAPWVTSFNRGKPADRWFGKSWERFRPDLDYGRIVGPDDVAGEGAGVKQGRVFPHPLDGGATRPARPYYEAMLNSPCGNELLLELAKRAIDAEKLGQHDTPDLLLLSFSSNDLVGHTWGPDSQEVFDITLRSDRIVAELLAHLDLRVGKGRYMLVLSADHGVCPLPEVAKAKGEDAARVSPKLLTSKAEEFLNETFNADKPARSFIEAASGLMVYFNQGTLKTLGLEKAKVEQSLAAWLKKQPGVQAAYTHAQLSAGPPKDDPYGASAYLSFDPERSGDVTVLLKPYHLLSSLVFSPKDDTYRTGHGTPYPYDTHVPLLVYGPGIRPGIRAERVSPLSVAAILAHGLGIAPPADSVAPVPPSLLRAKAEGR
jgi:predicted AlkP superfamily pyrophosphatase or phosphodiesterase